jgi:glucose-6-phosphate 1-dehydrogenase
VPFLIRTGKCLAGTVTEVHVTLKQPVGVVFDARRRVTPTRSAFG